MKFDIFPFTDDNDDDFGCDDACDDQADDDYDKCQDACQDYFGYMKQFTRILCIFHIILTILIIGFLIRSVW